MNDKIKERMIVEGIIYAGARRCDDVLDLSLLDLEVGFDKVVDIEYLKDVKVLKIDGNELYTLEKLFMNMESLEEVYIDGRNLNDISFARSKGCLMNLKRIVVYNMEIRLLNKK